MAIVANQAFIGDPRFPVDGSYWTAQRSGAADPNGAVTPNFAGEIYLDTTNKKLWQSVNLLNTSWITYNAGVNC